MRIGEFGKVLIKYASSQVVSNILRLLSGFLVVRLLAPNEFGLFSGVGVYTGYILLGSVGILSGLGRELPYELGRGNDIYARELASSAFVFTVYLSCLAAFLFFCFGLFYLVQGNLILSLLFLTYTIIAFLTLLSKMFLPSLYRTNNDFSSLSRQNMLIGVGNLISVLLVWKMNVWGLCLRAILLAIYETILLFKNKPYKLEWSWNKLHYKKLFKTGFPIFLGGHIIPLQGTILNNMIFSMGGPLSFGLYSLCNIINGALGIIPSAFGQVIYPRMSVMYGEGKSLSYIIKSNMKPLYFQLVLFTAIGIVGVFSLPPLVHIFLPKYAGGIAAAQWIMFFPAIQSFGGLLNIFGVIKKMSYFIIANIAGAVSCFAYVLIFYRIHGFDLVIFPQALIIGRIVQQGLSFVFLRRIMKEEVNAG